MTGAGAGVVVVETESMIKEMCFGYVSRRGRAGLDRTEFVALGSAGCYCALWGPVSNDDLGRYVI